MGAGFQHDIAGGSGNLITAQIQSPNFSLAGQTGWAILRNGNAYFFDITASGSITATSFDGTAFIIDVNGFFLYSGTPASGNLIASIAPASVTVDGFGNTVAGGGFSSYRSGGYSQLADGALVLETSGANSPGEVTMQAAGWIVMESGNASPGDSEAAVTALSADANGGRSLVALSAQTAQLVNSVATIPTTAPPLGTNGFGGGVWTAGQQSALLTMQTQGNDIINALAAVGIFT